MFIAYLSNNDRAAWWLIARGLGAYIFPRENFEKKEQDSLVWVYIF